MFKITWPRTVTTFLLFVTGYSNAMSKNATTFDWLATESAPSHYPMEIIQGDLFFHGQGGSRYIPSGGTLYAGWGNSISTHIGGDEKYPLPDRLSITFFSYTENQFYKGEFNLPYEKMLNLFRESLATDKIPFCKVMVGIAPGGAVSVWLAGGKTKEVFFGQAEKVDLKYGRVLGLRFNSQQEEDAFIYKQLTNVLKPEELKLLKKDGVPFGLWARYRNLYRWTITFTNEITLKRNEIPITYLNGEFASEKFPISKDFIETPRPLPRELMFAPMLQGSGKPQVIYFDEYEIMTAFERLHTSDELIQIRFEPNISRSLTRVYVYNGKESIELKKTIVSDR